MVFSALLYTNGRDAFVNTDETMPSVGPEFGILKPFLASGQRYLLSGNDDYALVYDDHDYVQWWNLVDDSYIKYPVPGRGGNWHATSRGPVCTQLRPHCQYLTGVAGYLAAIRAHDFAVVSITRSVSQQLPSDAAIEKAVRATPGYLLLTTADGPTWIYGPDYAHLRGSGLHPGSQ